MRFPRYTLCWLHCDSPRGSLPSLRLPGLSVLSATTAPFNCPYLAAVWSAIRQRGLFKVKHLGRDPPPSRQAPVIVGFTQAALREPRQTSSHNGQRLAEETGAIVVAPFYRLGPFGFLTHSALAAEDPACPSSGNYGLLDDGLLSSGFATTLHNLAGTQTM